MDLYHYLKPLISREAIDELKCFHAQKVYNDPDVTKEVKTNNLKYMVDFTRMNPAQMSSFMQDIFASLLHEGYLNLADESLTQILENAQNDEAFDLFQITGMYILKNDYSNLSTYFSPDEIKLLRKRISEGFLRLLQDETLSTQKRSIIADCLLLSASDPKMRNIANQFIRRVRQAERVEEEKAARNNRQNVEVIPRVKTSAKDVEIDSQNVHASNVTNIVKRKLLKLWEDQIPTRRTFYANAKVKPETQDDEKKEDKKKEENKTPDLLSFKIRIYFGAKDFNLALAERTSTTITSLEQKMYWDQIGRHQSASKETAGPAAPASLKNISQLDMMQEFDDITFVCTKILSVMMGPQVYAQINSSLQRISTDPVVFEPTTMTLSQIFQRVFNRVISQKDKDFFPDLMQRVYEELVDSKHVCATGYVTRILNILQGYPEIDFEVIHCYEEDLFKELQEMVEKAIDELRDQGRVKLAEQLDDGMIGITEEERKPFVDWVKETHMTWYEKMCIVWVVQRKIYFYEWFTEDYEVALKKLCGCDIKVIKTWSTSS